MAELWGGLSRSLSLLDRLAADPDSLTRTMRRPGCSGSSTHSTPRRRRRTASTRRPTPSRPITSSAWALGGARATRPPRLPRRSTNRASRASHRSARVARRAVPRPARAAPAGRSEAGARDRRRSGACGLRARPAARRRPARAGRRARLRRRRRFELWPVWVAGIVVATASILVYRPRPSGSRGLEPLQRALPSEQLDALEQAGRDLRAGDSQPDGRERLSRLLAQSSASRAGLLDQAAVQRRRRERGRRAARQISGSAPSGRDVLEEEAHEIGVLVEPLDLLLHERRGARTTSPRPSRSPAREPGEQSARRTRPEAARGGGRRSASRASRSRTSPGSARRARARTARPARRGHDRRVVVEAPAEQREEVHQRVGEVAQLAEHVDGDGAVALGELLAIVAEHVPRARRAGGSAPSARGC